MENKFVDMWVKEFTIDSSDPYFPEKDYVLVSPNPDEDKMNNLIDLFYNRNGLISYNDDMFIIPKTVFQIVLAPTFRYVNSMRKKEEKEKKEGGEN